MTSRADRLAARFANLVEPVADVPADGPPQTVDGRDMRPTAVTEETSGLEREKAQGWDATHRRVTYWMHVDVVQGVREAAKRNGESVAGFVDRALRSELRRSRHD